MNSIHISEHRGTVSGLSAMLVHYCDYDLNESSWVPLEMALVLFEVARLAEDREEWFPRGKWATIQHLRGKIEAELADAMKQGQIAPEVPRE